MEVFDGELLAIGLALDLAIEKRDPLQKHGVKTVAVFSDSQAAIRRAAHLEPGQGAATGEADQQEGAEPPRPRHHNRDPLGPRALRHPWKRRSRPSGELGPRCKWKHGDRAAIHLGLE